MTLHARLLPPVPPPEPPAVPLVFPAGLETPEQLVKNRARAERAERRRKSFQAEQGQRIVQQLSATPWLPGKRPLGHVRILKTP
jgi:hypothetical protein